MIPGLLGGRYGAEELLIDLPALARAAGADFVPARVRSLEPGERRVVLEDGSRIAYDLLSLAIGSGNAAVALPGVREAALLLKPIGRTLEIVPALERAVDAAGSQGPAVVVVGGGAAGVEVALNLRARLRLLGRPGAPVTVVDGEERILRDRSDACARAAESALATNGVSVRLGDAVEALEPGRLRLAGGRLVEADLVVWATGAAAPPLFRHSGLATDPEGFLLVDPALRSVSMPEIFAAGDAASVMGYPAFAKAGVYAVREGPVLRDNLAAVLAGRPAVRRFRPQRRFLALLNTGDGRAIFSYGPFAATGRWAMALKDRIDRRFMKRFRR